MESYQVSAAKAAPVSVVSSLTFLVVFLGITYLAVFKWKRRRLEKLGSQLPGPPALPIIGNGLEFVGDPEDYMAKLVALSKIYESPFRIWSGPNLYVVINKPDDLQIVLNSSKTLQKSPLYRFFRDVVGTGLFTAPVEKWKRSRRVITPAFNTFLLEQFVPVFNRQNRILVEKMAKMVGQGMFDVYDFLIPASLDIICLEKWKRSRRVITPAFNTFLLEQFVPVFNRQNRILVEKMAKMVGQGMFDVYDFLIPASLDIICLEKWKRSRRVITPAFNTFLLEQFVPVFNRQNRILVEKMAKMVGQGMFDVYDFLIPASLDIICQTSMGVDIKAQDNPNCHFATACQRYCNIVSIRCYKLWLHPDFIFNRFSYAEELRHLSKYFHDLANSLIQQKKEEFRKNKEESKNKPEIEQVDINKNKKEKKLKVFVDILLELKDSGTNFSDDDLRDEVMTMIIAGSETIGLTNSFCLLMLAMHEDVQDKAFEEVYSIFGDSDRGVTIEDLNRMGYLEMVIKETLRKFPVAPIFQRKVLEDIEITNYTLPQGVNVIIAPVATHMNPSLYPDPEQFDPERFTPEAIAERHRYAYIPFSGGPRGCIGSKFAVLSMKTTISNILRSYKLFTSVKMEDIKLKADLMIHSVNGYQIMLEHRRSS